MGGISGTEVSAGVGAVFSAVFCCRIDSDCTGRTKDSSDSVNNGVDVDCNGRTIVSSCTTMFEGCNTGSTNLSGADSDAFIDGVIAFSGSDFDMVSIDGVLVDKGSGLPGTSLGITSFSVGKIVCFSVVVSDTASLLVGVIASFDA